MKKKFWIAVDENGSGYIYDKKPKRSDTHSYWQNIGKSHDLISSFMYEHLNLTWESEPYEIEI